MRRMLPFVLALLFTASASAAVRKIEMTAKKYEYSPAKLELVRGEEVELTIRSLDKTHGFDCPGLELEGTITPKKPLVLHFTHAKAGTFPFKCNHWCGFGHGHMKGEIVVAEPDGEPTSP